MKQHMIQQVLKSSFIISLFVLIAVSSLAAQDIQQKQADLLRPLVEKARAAIQKVAREQGFDYVIDATPGGALILSDGKDLLAEVKKELGF